MKQDFNENNAPKEDVYHYIYSPKAAEIYGTTYGEGIHDHGPFRDLKKMIFYTAKCKAGDDWRADYKWPDARVVHSAPPSTVRELCHNPPKNSGDLTFSKEPLDSKPRLENIFELKSPPKDLGPIAKDIDWEKSSAGDNGFKKILDFLNGEKTDITPYNPLKPGNEGEGFVFKRSDLKGWKLDKK